MYPTLGFVRAASGGNWLVVSSAAIRSPSPSR